MASKLLFTLALVSLGFAGTLKAQTKSPEEVSEKQAKAGTYQLEFLKGVKQDPIALSGDLLKNIETHRDPEKTTCYNINNNVRVRILSEKEVSSPKFAPLKEDYILVNKID
jgi:hypothetical protein